MKVDAEAYLNCRPLRFHMRWLMMNC